ncbi:dihydrofolate reductase family protein [Sutterella sp.]|uniref:dihydrofolate reductase family protein n=1 Tax=Sutterella sp. TaxID=1981025 RepID=UPI0026DF4D72|nr:dihydrofolate reductase family protein [Sutterella sp.]MDO5532154.1 dihydrofolate reductase family protein [Sutterella sp.]
MFITCHMIASLDGRLLPARWSEPAEPYDVSGVYEAAASKLEGEGWIVGRTTISEYCEEIRTAEPAPLRAEGEPVPEGFTGDRGGRLIAVAFDPKGKLRPGLSTLPTGEHLVLVLSPRVAESHLAELRSQGVSYVFEGAEGDEAARMAAALDAIEARFGVKHLLLEGGGIINGAFLKAGLIDAISVLVCPALDALHSAPSIFGYVGAPDERPAENVRLALTSSETMAGGVVWLRYRVENL